MALQEQSRLFHCSISAKLLGGGSTANPADLLLLSMRETSLTHMRRTADNSVSEVSLATNCILQSPARKKTRDQPQSSALCMGGATRLVTPHAALCKVSYGHAAILCMLWSWRPYTYVHESCAPRASGHCMHVSSRPGQHSMAGAKTDEAPAGSMARQQLAGLR